ncbi:heme biosynthesis protein HemY [Robbsia sp. Bb-Pol-6]|uniref:Heme biosynthesis protein HemY n=1 Tax=Robbsia betulipollinis TaxID=2981849 RepID=A0ABT3ZLX3_9BURK|nr:heme biosynthesis protein HemY [Robbsia betulipollinis]MCY0387462.1 heme biosynthesis protein HemY [Robbsia betulipollinis]
MTIKGLLWIAALFVFAVALALAGRFEQGHVILIYAPYRVDMSLHALVGLIIVAFVLTYVLIRVFRSIVRMPSRVSGYRARARAGKAQAALRDALGNLYAGRFSRAEKAARVAATLPENRDGAGLIGALAAHRMRESERRDTWLDGVTAPQWQDAKLMTLAEMQVDAHDPQAALAALNLLEDQGAKRLRAQQIGLRAHKALQNWGEVLRLVRALAKREAIHPATAAHLERQAAEHLLRERRHDGDALTSCWQALPEATRLAPRIADLCAELLLALDRAADARRIVETALAAEWDARLVRRFGGCGGTDPLPLIQRAETWQGAHPEDADLCFALGRLCVQQRLWGKAQSFLEAALRLAQDDTLKVRTHRALARMHETLGNLNEANVHYRASAMAVNLN